MLAVGHAVAPLPVLLGEPLGGYIDRTGGAIGSLEPLEVHAISISTGETRILLLVIDLICVNTDLVARIRESVLELGVEAVWVSATHAHSTPEAGCFPGGATTPAEVAQRVSTAARAATRDAIDAERTAVVRAVRTDVSEVGGRRNVPPSGAPTVPIDAIAFDGIDGERLGLLVVTPVHPTVFGADNRLASADLAGGVRRALAPDAQWAVAATGAAGDISTRATRRARSLAEIDRLAGRIASALRGALAAPTPATIGGLILPISRTISLPASGDSEHALLAPRLDPADAFSERRRVVLEQGLALAAANRERLAPGTTEVTLEVFALAHIRLVAVPAELYLSLAERIRTEHPFPGPVIVIGYTNGYLGYLPDADAPVSYETVVSPVGRGSGELLVAAALEQLFELESTPYSQGVSA
ncbi:hypothetical protein ACFCVO_11035 [Agromyces sp. NPDC056379]|uniref:hypothetical protein n=1 Tax=unclassified Agromyces TaxID=2639701 RepID=UPI0035D588EA